VSWGLFHNWEAVAVSYTDAGHTIVLWRCNSDPCDPWRHGPCGRVKSEFILGHWTLEQVQGK
jgi:hypothetical protein